MPISSIFYRFLSTQPKTVDTLSQDGFQKLKWVQKWKFNTVNKHNKKLIKYENTFAQKFSTQ